MTSLLDIAARSERVPVEGLDPIEVWGISLRGIAQVLMRFPPITNALKKAVGLGAGEEVEAELPAATALDIMQLVPDAVKVIIAMGARKGGDPEYEEAADNLPAVDQLNLMEAIIRLSVGGGGIVPFGVRVFGLVGNPDAIRSLNGATDGKNLPGTSPLN